MWVFGGVAALLCCASVALPFWMTFAVCALTALTFFGLASHRRAARVAQALSVQGHLELQGAMLVRIDPAGKASPLLSLEARFGVSIMVAERARYAWIGLTTAARTGILRVALETPKSALAALASCGVPDDFDALAPTLSEAHGLALLAMLEESGRGCQERLLLTGSHGESITLDMNALQVDDARIALAEPFECTRFSFCEPVGRVSGLYDATWLKQGGHEIVLIAARGADLRDAHRGFRAPPPQSLRHAIDRAFFPSLCSALQARSNTSRPSSTIPPRS
jgi:hypothetical protein